MLTRVCFTNSCRSIGHLLNPPAWSPPPSASFPTAAAQPSLASSAGPHGRIAGASAAHRCRSIRPPSSGPLPPQSGGGKRMPRIVPPGGAAGPDLQGLLSAPRRRRRLLRIVIEYGGDDRHEPGPQLRGFEQSE